MKIITLNTWGGLAGEEKLLSFFERNKDADIFCLQEVLSVPDDDFEKRFSGRLKVDFNDVVKEGARKIDEVLENHKGYFRPHLLENYGLMMFVNKDLDVEKEGEVFVHREKDFVPKGDLGGHARNIQYVKFQDKNSPLTVINFHGLWNGKGKSDSPDRIKQSQKIASFMQNIEEEIILCGDFNLRPDTESINILESAGLRNLVKEFGIKSTRTSFYKKPEKYADYILTSKGIDIQDFKVLPDEVSDHAPLYLEIGNE